MPRCLVGISNEFNFSEMGLQTQLGLETKASGDKKQDRNTFLKANCCKITAD